MEENNDINYAEYWEMICKAVYFLGIENKSDLPLISPFFNLLCNNKDVAKKFIENYEKVEKENIRDNLVKAEFFYDFQNDLHSSEVLYNHGIYNHAIYHMQQSVEKLAKYWLMEFNGWSYKKIRDISHDAPLGYVIYTRKELTQIYNIAIKSFKNMPKNEDFLKLKREYIKGKKTIDGLLDKNWIRKKNGKYYLQTQIKKIISMATYTEITSVLKKINLIIDEFRNAFKNPYNKAKLLNLMKIIGDEQIDLDFLESKLDWIMQFVEIYFNAYMAGVYLYVLGVYTFPHESYSRYYEDKDGLTPSKYNKELGIVRAAPEIFELLNKIKRWYYEYDEAIKTLKQEVAENA